MIVHMKRIRECEWCHRRLKGYGEAEVCPSCQEKLKDVLDRHLELVNIALTVQQAAIQLNMHPGHVRRILEHPEKYPWRYYGITQAYRAGKEWVVFLTPLEHRKELANQLVNIGESALNIVRVKTFLDLKPVFTLMDMRTLLECQVVPLPRRKNPRESREQIERLRRDPERAVDQLITALANFVEEIVADDKATAPYSFNRSATP